MNSIVNLYYVKWFKIALDIYIEGKRSRWVKIPCDSKLIVFDRIRIKVL